MSATSNEPWTTNAATKNAALTGLALEVEDVDLHFGGIHALRTVSFSAEPGAITAIIGPNGAGKTSLFNTISGFYRPARGEIRLGGRIITARPSTHAPRSAWRARSRTSPCFRACRCSRTSSLAAITP